MTHYHSNMSVVWQRSVQQIPYVQMHFQSRTRQVGSHTTSQIWHLLQFNSRHALSKFQNDRCPAFRSSQLFEMFTLYFNHNLSIRAVFVAVFSRQRLCRLDSFWTSSTACRIHPYKEPYWSDRLVRAVLGNLYKIHFKKSRRV